MRILRNKTNMRCLTYTAALAKQNGYEAIELPNGKKIPHTMTDAEVQRAVKIPDSVIEKELSDGYEDMHWRHLKAEVEKADGTWTTKKDAIEFLRAL